MIETGKLLGRRIVIPSLVERSGDRGQVDVCEHLEVERPIEREHWYGGALQDGRWIVVEEEAHPGRRQLRDDLVELCGVYVAVFPQGVQLAGELFGIVGRADQLVRL